jgi:hypothetical protein
MSHNYDLLLEMPSSYLKTIARDLGLSGYSTLAKQELVDFLLTNTSLKSLGPYIDDWKKERAQTEKEGLLLEREFRDAEINKQIDQYNDELLHQQLTNLQFVPKRRQRPSPYARKGARAATRDSMMSQFGHLRL